MPSHNRFHDSAVLRYASSVIPSCLRFCNTRKSVCVISLCDYPLQCTEYCDGVPVDMGGAYVGGTQDRILRVAKQFGVKTYAVHKSGKNVAEVLTAVGCSPLTSHDVWGFSLWTGLLTLSWRNGSAMLLCIEP